MPSKHDPAEELAIHTLLAEDSLRETKQGAVYPGNMGVMEMIQFYRIGTPAQQALMNKLLTAGKEREAWALLKKVTGVQLHDPPEWSSAHTASKPPEGLVAALAAGLKNPKEALSEVKDILGELGDAAVDQAEVMAPNLLPYKAESRTQESNGRTTDSQSYWYEVGYPTKVHLSNKFFFDLGQTWERLVSAIPDWKRGVPHPKLTPDMAQEVAEAITRRFQGVNLDPQDLQNEDAILDWLWEKDLIRDDVSSYTLDEDGNELRENESGSPEYHWDLRPAGVVVTTKLQGTDLLVKLVSSVTIKLRNVAMPGDYDYGRNRAAATKLPPGWELLPKSQSGNYIIYVSPSGLVRVQDTKRTGHPMRYQVIYQPVSQSIVLDGESRLRRNTPKGQWLEVDNKSSLAAAVAVGVQTEKHLKDTQGRTASEPQHLKEYVDDENIEYAVYPMQNGKWAFRVYDRDAREAHAIRLHATQAKAEAEFDKTVQQVKKRRASRAAKSNAEVLEIPHTFHQVELLDPQKKRKEFPFEGFIDFQGLEIDVENAKGSTRSGTGPDGDWSVHMFAHYGEIRGTEGVDGDKLDVYVGDNHDSSLVVVIHQHDPEAGTYDEDKVILGCESIEEAIGLYKKQYNRPGFYQEGEHTAMPIGAFWRWVKDERNKGKKVKVAQRGGVMWKRGYTEDQPGAINTARNTFSNLLAMLRAIQWNHLASHWQSAGDASYGDHLLFERLYSKVVGEVDGLAEKLVGTFGTQAVESKEQATLMAATLHRMSDIGDPFERGLLFERTFQVYLKACVQALDDMGQLSLGMDDFLRTMANDHETHIYLLQQRQGGLRVASQGKAPDLFRAVVGRQILRQMTAALVGTDSSTIYAIAPEQLAHLIESGGWLKASEAEDHTKADKLIRQHGGAVFQTGGDSKVEVTVEGATDEAGYMKPYGTEGYAEAIKKLGREVALDLLHTPKDPQ